MENNESNLEQKLERELSFVEKSIREHFLPRLEEELSQKYNYTDTGKIIHFVDEVLKEYISESEKYYKYYEYGIGLGGHYSGYFNAENPQSSFESFLSKKLDKLTEIKPIVEKINKINNFSPY